MSHDTCGHGDAIMSGIKISRVSTLGSLKGRDVENGGGKTSRM